MTTSNLMSSCDDLRQSLRGYCLTAIDRGVSKTAQCGVRNKAPKTPGHEALTAVSRLQ